VEIAIACQIFTFVDRRSNMNLSSIERMVREGDLSLDACRYLIECHGECEWLDHKEVLRLETDEEISKFARTIVGMKNVGGGYLVIGVRDKSWEPVGLRERIPYDSKMLRDRVKCASGLDLEIDIVQHEVQGFGFGGLFGLVLVRTSSKRHKRRSPSVIKKDFCRNMPYGLRSGDIYVRKGDSSVKVRTQEELEDLLDHLEAQSDEDALNLEGRASPFAVVDGSYRLLETGFQKFIGREHLKEEVLNAVIRDPRIWIINVHGPGGVGKSALVNWVTYEFYRRREFEAIIHLTAKETILTARGIVPFSRTLYSLENLLAGC
jgi:hypothetical protein